MRSTVSMLCGVCFWRGLAGKLETLIEKLNFSKQLNLNKQVERVKQVLALVVYSFSHGKGKPEGGDVIKVKRK